MSSKLTLPARQGLGGEGPNADADNRADKAVQIDGAVPTRERHPQLIEDLKAFLGEKGHTKQVEPEEPISHLASPFHAKSPEQARRTVAEAMSSHDGGGQGLELRGLGHLGHVAAGPLGDSAAASAECAPRSITATTAAAGTSSLGDGQAEYRRHSVCSTHGHTGGATSMEDKCLECCVYYGVMCCQCTIL
ncbi:hypothetical protein FOCC_FOCC004266 [Frankliniella occidentalis]|nr:hypothetical protein FOCC_FOCC004266 [Frankliniella occidentalis]